MWMVVFGIIFGYLGMGLGYFLLNEAGGYLFGAAGFFTPAFIVLGQIHRKIMNDEPKEV